MESNQLLETRGMIVKEEKVISLGAPIFNNRMVLESKDPLPGYFGKNIPDMEKPRSVFVILAKEYEHLYLARKLKEFSEKKKHKCYSAFGKLQIKHKNYSCIRVKNLDCFESLSGLLEMLADEGVQLEKYHEINDHALMEIHKGFLLSSLTDQIYKDEFEPHHYYFDNPKLFSWEKFKEITDRVKNNMDNNLFDAAMGVFWTLEGPKDVIRIYDKKTDLKRLEEIREKYLKKIQRL